MSAWQRLWHDYATRRIDRRSFTIRAAALGISAPLISIMAANPRVFAQDAALQEERISLACPVAHFAQPIDALVRVDPYDRARHGSTAHREGTHIGNLQVGRLGVRIRVLR